MEQKIVPGIIYIGKTTYGHIKDKVLYLAKPCKEYKKKYNYDDILLPVKDRYNFNKNYDHYYILINYDKKIIHKNIGKVSDYNAFCEYQMYIHEINKVHIKPKQQFTKINVDITDNRNIYSVDPDNTIDIDDAFSIDNNELCIYITNPTYVLNMIDCDIKQLENRPQTIYIKPNKINMLPDIIADNMCSLLANKIRHVIRLRIKYVNGYIKEYEFSKEIIKVNMNHNYESDIAHKLSDFIYNNIGERYDTHKSIEYIMKLFNTHTIKYVGDNLIYRYINVDNIGQYTKEKLVHSVINDLYIHITSPLRRYIDLLNMRVLLNKLDGNECKLDMDIDIDKINLNNKNIRKIENRCNLYYLFYDTDYTNEYKGTIIDKIDNKYVISYIDKNNDEYKLYVSSEYDLILNSECIFKVFIYNNEGGYDKKIKIIVIEKENE